MAAVERVSLWQLQHDSHLNDEVDAFGAGLLLFFLGHAILN